MCLYGWCCGYLLPRGRCVPLTCQCDVELLQEAGLSGVAREKSKADWVGTHLTVDLCLCGENTRVWRVARKGLWVLCRVCMHLPKLCHSGLTHHAQAGGAAVAVVIDQLEKHSAYKTQKNENSACCRHPAKAFIPRSQCWITQRCKSARFSLN